MSGIVLSASVRQNLLALQNTASLLATTQNNLATGNKVNTALDNPTEFFTAQSLNNRASDIANLLDSIGNGVQVLQAANTGLTSLQKLVDSAKSIASQVLQAPTGYTTKSSVTSAVIPGATANNLLGSSSNKFATGTVVNNDNLSTAVAITGTTRLSGTATSTSNNLATGITTGDTLTVNGVVFTFVAGSVSAGTNIGVGDTVSNLLAAIDSVTGASATPSSVSGGAIAIATGTAQDLTLGGTALAKLGLNSVGSPVTRNPPALTGQTLTIASTGGGVATNITFGTGASQISTLAQLNTALAANNLQASLSTTGQLTILTTNEAASSTIGAVAGSSTTVGAAFNGVTASGPVADTNSQTTRAGLIAQYNNVLAQINTTAQDASFNGINLLNGDTLKLTFNETGRSTLNITGVTFNSTGLGLSSLVVGTDFLDSNSANQVLSTLNTASTAIRSEASSLGSNLSIVQIRQDFNKNLINVLQTGSSNLTLADTNEEAANSQALSTRQSIAVSALALANQSQASVLQLLR
ncbi:flagellin [Bradyrhizobium sp. HKCCYLR20261]|uniref:flagellin N-terminal helical domain-containing protein n=1 Tax=unclassified Bradyrhizobium TaxID=2631580 RepID=UPI003EBB8716